MNTFQGCYESERFTLPWINAEANGVFLLMTLVYLCVSHIQSILDIYAGLSNSCELTCLSSLRISAVWFCWLHSSSSTLNNWHTIQDNYTLCFESFRLEKTSKII